MSARRRHFLTLQRDTRRRREAERLGTFFAEAVRQRREQLSADTPGVPPHAGDGLRQAVAGPSNHGVQRAFPAVESTQPGPDTPEAA